MAEKTLSKPSDQWGELIQFPRSTPLQEDLRCRGKVHQKIDESISESQGAPMLTDRSVSPRKIGEGPLKLPVSFRLPRQSCLIEPHVFWHYIRLMRSRGSRTLRFGSVRITGRSLYSEYSGPFPELTTLDFRSNIRRCYISTDFADQMTAWYPRHRYVDYAMGESALLNVRKLIQGKFKPMFLGEAAEEIENQLSHIRDHKTRSGKEKAVFRHFKWWEYVHRGKVPSDENGQLYLMLGMAKGGAE